MTWAFQDEAGLRQAGASPSGHSDAWWAVAEKAAKYLVAAPGVAPAPGKAGSPWQCHALAQEQAGLALPVQGSAPPEGRSWQAQLLSRLRLRASPWVWRRAWRLRAQQSEPAPRSPVLRASLPVSRASAGQLAWRWPRSRAPHASQQALRPWRAQRAWRLAAATLAWPQLRQLLAWQRVWRRAWVRASIPVWGQAWPLPWARVWRRALP